MSKWCCGTNSAAKWWRPPDTITSWDQTLTHFFPPPWSVSLNMAIAALQINSRSMQRIPAPSNWFHVYSFASKRQSVTGEQLDLKKRHNCFWIRGGITACLFVFATRLTWSGYSKCKTGQTWLKKKNSLVQLKMPHITMKRRPPSKCTRTGGGMFRQANRNVWNVLLFHKLRSKNWAHPGFQPSQSPCG